MQTSALIDGPYRYQLARWWEDGPRVAFIMLNPSTADAFEDDPTIRKCIGFAKRWGYKGIEVVNLYALRSTDPKNLYEAVGPDPVGPKNDHFIVSAAVRSRMVVCAWGLHGAKPVWGGICVGRTEHVRQLLKQHNVDPMCLGLTKTGKPRQPRHPLMLSYKTKLEWLEKEKADDE